MNTPTLKTTQISNERARLREDAQILGDLLREERRADDAALAQELAESEREFWRLVDQAMNESE